MRRRGNARWIRRAAALLFCFSIPAAATAAIVFSEDFESGNFNAWDEAWVDSGQWTFCTDPARVHSGSRSAQGNLDSLPSDGKLAKWFLPGPHEIYFTTWVMFDSDVDSGNDNHFLHIIGNRIDDRYSGHGVAGTIPDGTDFFAANADLTDHGGSLPGPGAFMFYTYWMDMSGRWGNTMRQPDPLVMVPDRWYCVEHRLKANDPGSYNGLQTLWIDGQQVLTQSNMRWRTTLDLRPNNIWIVLRNRAPVPGHLWIDDIVVSDQRMPVAGDSNAPAIGITDPTGSPETVLPAIEIAGTASDDFYVASVTWENSAGGSGAATGTSAWSASVPLSIGENTITVTAEDGGGNTDTAQITVTRTEDTEPPSVSIATPTSGEGYETYATSIILGGTASDNGAVAHVTISNEVGWTATAGGTESWYHNIVPVIVGRNLITVRATDLAGLTAVDTIEVTRLTGDGPPTVSIDMPTSEAAFETDADTVTLSGTAGDNGIVVDVSWTSSRGWGGTAEGTVVWQAANVPLEPGANVLTVIARDDSGYTGSAELTVIRTTQEDDDPDAPGESGLAGLLTGDDPPRRIYGVVTPRDAAPQIYVGVSEDALSDVRFRLVSALGFVAGEWTGEHLIAVEDGVYAADLSGTDLANGAYVGELTVGGERHTRSVIVIR